MARGEVTTGWARAKTILESALRSRAMPAASVEVGWVKHIGDGLSRVVFGAHVDVSPDPGGLSGEYVALLPKRDSHREDHARWVRETRVLRQLCGEELPFRVPEPVGVFPDRLGPALVRRYLQGIPADLKAGRMSSVRPPCLVGSLAGATHRIRLGAWPDVPSGHPTRRGHGEEAMAVFDDLSEPEIREARGWAREHLPSTQPAVLLHGDLLGQNILLCPGEPLALIDWEFCRMGDPAYDLAIVTRGTRRPFQMADGLSRLLESYEQAGGERIRPASVHFHEICLAVSWYRAALDGEGAELPEQALGRVRGILGRAAALA